MKYWEIIADNLSKAGSELGACDSGVDPRRRTVFVADKLALISEICARQANRDIRCSTTR